MKGFTALALAAGALALAGAAALPLLSDQTAPAAYAETIWPETEHEFLDVAVTDLTGQAEGRVETITRNPDGTLHSLQVVWTSPEGETIGMVDHPVRFVSLDAEGGQIIAQIGWPELHAGYREASRALKDGAAPFATTPPSSDFTGTS